MFDWAFAEGHGRCKFEIFELRRGLSVVRGSPEGLKCGQPVAIASMEGGFLWKVSMHSREEACLRPLRALPGAASGGPQGPFGPSGRGICAFHGALQGDVWGSAQHVSQLVIHSFTELVSCPVLGSPMAR